MAIETLGAALRTINHLFQEGSVTGLSDAELLERFLTARDAAAFESLVARHGPMVLSVCRGVLRDSNDAEDAFQATFLVLVKKGGSIRGREALGGWLYQVAHRVALRANTAATRRSVHERQAGLMATATSAPGPGVRDELLRALHEEIALLPEKFRLAIVLCDLQGIPQDRAAGELHLSERTLRRRLSEGRQRLKARLDRRGLATDGAMMGALFLREAKIAIPAAWLETTVRAAQSIGEPIIAAGAVSAAAATLSHEVIAIMLLQKLKLASAALVTAGLMACGVTAAFATRGDEPAKDVRTTNAGVARAAPAPAARPVIQSDPLDTVGRFPVRGQVLDPDGKPVAGAAIYITHRRTAYDWSRYDPVPPLQKGQVATAGADGQFQFELEKGASDWPFADGPGWHEAEIAAVAPGFGPAWTTAKSLLAGGSATWQLVRDDVPIRGRNLDTQGRPVAGMTVRINDIATPGEGTDLDALLAEGELKYEKVVSYFGSPIWLGDHGTWKTGPDGRFEIKGVGRDRIAGLSLEGDALEHARFYAISRPARATEKPQPRPTRPSRDMLRFGPRANPRLMGSTFDQIVGPAKPITGVVRLKETGKPATGIAIVGIEPVTRTLAYAQTDAQGRFRLIGLPKADVYQVHVEPKPGIDPFLRVWTTVNDSEGLKPIEMVCELPRGVIVTGRLIDKATGRIVLAKEVLFIKLPTNRNEGSAVTRPGRPGEPTFGLTVPPGGGMLLARASGQETPYARARLRKADKGKGVGGPGDGETRTTIMNGHHAYRIIDVPANAQTFSVDLELTRGVTRKGRVTGPDCQPVIGAQCYGLGSTWGYITTLTDETFEVHALEQGYPRRVIFAHQARRLVGSVVIKDEDLTTDTPLNVRLGPAGSIKGRLIDEDGLPLAGAELSVTSFDLDGNNLPHGRGGVWPDDTTFTADADGRFQVEGLKPGVRSSIGVKAKIRANHRLDTGRVFRDIILKKVGEVRDLGEVKVRAVPQ